MADASMHPSDSQTTHPGVGFEPTDISFRGVLATIVIVACLIPLHQVLTLKLFELDRRYPEKSQEAGFASVTRAAALPHEPRLEQLDRLAGIKTPDVYLREENKETILHSYGQASEKGFVHVPIDWTIQQAAEQLPFRATTRATPARDQGLLDAGQSNSGRVFRGEKAK